MRRPVSVGEVENSPVIAIAPSPGQFDFSNSGLKQPPKEFALPGFKLTFPVELIGTRAIDTGPSGPWERKRTHQVFAATFSRGAPFNHYAIGIDPVRPASRRAWQRPLQGGRRHGRNREVGQREDPQRRRAVRDAAYALIATA